MQDFHTYYILLQKKRVAKVNEAKKNNKFYKIFLWKFCISSDRSIDLSVHQMGSTRFTTGCLLCVLLKAAFERIEFATGFPEAIKRL